MGLATSYWDAARSVLEGSYIENLALLRATVGSVLREEPIKDVLRFHAVIDAENVINSGSIDAQCAYQSRVFASFGRESEREGARALLEDLASRYAPDTKPI